MKKLLPLFLLLVCITPVCADGFSNSGDIAESKFYSTISYTLGGDLPEKIDVDNGVLEYDPSEVLAVSTEDILEMDTSWLFEDSVKRRINSNGTYIALPPGTSIDVLYNYWNDTGHLVDIEEIAIAYTRGYISFMGYLTGFGDFENGEYTLSPIPLNYFGDSFIRKGIFRKYEGLNSISAGNKGSIIVDKMNIIMPLSISEPVVERVETGVKITILFKNETYDVLSDISFKHGSVERSLTLQPKGEYELEYILSGDFPDGNLGSFVVEDGNIGRKCTVLGTNYSNAFFPESVSLFSKRADGGWVAGGSIGPVLESFCMTRIPYVFTSHNMKIEGMADEEDEIPVGDNLVDEEDEILSDNLVDEDYVLGVADKLLELPNTGLVDNTTLLVCGVSLLVVDAFLWYSVVRKKNEKRNIFTKICTKGCKNLSKRRA